MPDSDDLEARLKEAGVDLQAVEQLAETLASQKATNRLRNRSPESVATMRAISKAFNQRATFRVGDVVRWKLGLKNKRNPAYDGPAVVFEVLKTPLFDAERDGGSQYFHEPLDLLIGFFPEEDAASVEEPSAKTYHVDSRRFELHPDFAAGRRAAPGKRTAPRKRA
jgi:hypothetical protein